MPSSFRYRKIVCGIDLVPGAPVVLAHAVALAQAVGAELSVVHVSESVEPMLPFSAANRAAAARLRADSLRVARSELDRVMEPALRVLPGAKMLVRSGSATAELLRHVRRVKAELLVVGTRAGGPVAQLFLGSTAQRVLRNAPCPVVLVPPEIGKPRSVTSRRRTRRR